MIYYGLSSQGLVEKPVIRTTKTGTRIMAKEVISIEAQASVLRSMSPEKVDETIANLADRYANDLRAALARLEERSQAEEFGV